MARVGDVDASFAVARRNAVVGAATEAYDDGSGVEQEAMNGSHDLLGPWKWGLRAARPRNVALPLSQRSSSTSGRERSRAGRDVRGSASAGTVPGGGAGAAMTRHERAAPLALSVILASRVRPVKIAAP